MPFVWLAAVDADGIRSMESSGWAAQAPLPVTPDEDIQVGDAMAAGAG